VVGDGAAIGLATRICLQVAHRIYYPKSNSGDTPMSVNNRINELLEFFKTNPPPEEVYKRYYDENVVVQENMQPPRVGRALSIERQKLMNANVKEIHDFKIGAV
jgi:hypothetical protein